MMNKVIFFIVTMAGFSMMSSAQNMVVNPSFENMKKCPYSMNQLDYTENWFPLGTADPSPDLFHYCDFNGNMGIPNNMFGYQEARTGKAYIGMITYLTSKSEIGWKVPSNHREFIMVELSKPLVAGNQYYAEMWVNLADNCEYATNSLGMYFTKDIPHIDWQAMNFDYYKPQVNSSVDSLLDDNKKWIKISGTFTAKGGELALTIGNFYKDSRITVKKTKRKFPYQDKKISKSKRPQISYYYIDDLLVSPINLSESIYQDEILVKRDTTIVDEYFGPTIVGRKVILQNVLFEFDKSDFLNHSFSEMDRLYDYLRKNKLVKIQINGHTDNVGDMKYNIKLSFQRAKAVYEYLIWKGINEYRLEYKGYGSSLPIVSNNTEKGRAMNRRVEFIVLSK